MKIAISHNLFAIGATAFALQARDVVSRLPQQRTINAPTLPFYLDDGAAALRATNSSASQPDADPQAGPWSPLNLDTNYYHDYPRTGKTRSYDFTISRGVIAPDGYQVDALLVNGAYPGPLIKANWGDTIQVTVHNNISGPEEGVALHWHGFLQEQTPWEDGVPAVSQCPIPPGKSFTYSFLAKLYGTTWYHSHYSAQYGGGLLGPLVVFGPRERHHDIDLGPVMLSDWYHRDYNDLVKQTLQPNARPVISDNNLINGKNNFDCSKRVAGDQTPCTNNAGISKFRFQRGKTHRLRLINVGSEGLQRFSIDGHKMTVIANDFVTVEPYETDVVTLGIGQRTDVLVKADGKLDAYWMRSNISTICSFANQPLALAAVYYDDTDINKEPTSTALDRPDPGTCANDDLELTKPRMKLKLPNPDKEYVMELNLTHNATGHALWTLDKVTFRGNYNSPTLLMGLLGNTTFEPQWNVKNTGNAASVRVHVKNLFPVSHPIHLHGFNMFVLHEGPGEWDGTIVNPQNPQRRDVIQLQDSGHLVVQFNAGENPGVWPFHCHIAWHASAGLFSQFLTGVDKLRNMRPPSAVAETCRQWADYTKTHIPDQIDSGL